MKNRERAFDKQGLKEVRAYHQGKLTLSGSLVGVTDVRVDWTVWKRTLGRFIRDQRRLQRRPKS